MATGAANVPTSPAKIKGQVEGLQALRAMRAQVSEEVADAKKAVITVPNLRSGSADQRIDALDKSFAALNRTSALLNKVAGVADPADEARFKEEGGDLASHNALLNKIPPNVTEQARAIFMQGQGIRGTEAHQNTERAAAQALDKVMDEQVKTLANLKEDKIREDILNMSPEERQAAKLGTDDDVNALIADIKALQLAQQDKSKLVLETQVTDLQNHVEEVDPVDMHLRVMKHSGGYHGVFSQYDDYLNFTGRVFTGGLHFSSEGEGRGVSIDGIPKFYQPISSAAAFVGANLMKHMDDGKSREEACEEGIKVDYLNMNYCYVDGIQYLAKVQATADAMGVKCDINWGNIVKNNQQSGTGIQRYVNGHWKELVENASKDVQKLIARQPIEKGAYSGIAGFAKRAFHSVKEMFSGPDSKRISKVDENYTTQDILGEYTVGDQRWWSSSKRFEHSAGVTEESQTSPEQAALELGEDAGKTQHPLASAPPPSPTSETGPDQDTGPDRAPSLGVKGGKS